MKANKTKTQKLQKLFLYFGWIVCKIKLDKKLRIYLHCRKHKIVITITSTRFFFPRQLTLVKDSVCERFVSADILRSTKGAVLEFTVENCIASLVDFIEVTPTVAVLLVGMVIPVEENWYVSVDDWFCWLLLVDGKTLRPDVDLMSSVFTSRFTKASLTDCPLLSVEFCEAVEVNIVLVGIWPLCMLLIADVSALNNVIPALPDWEAKPCPAIPWA